MAKKRTKRSARASGSLSKLSVDELEAVLDFLVLEYDSAPTTEAALAAASGMVRVRRELVRRRAR